MSTRRSAIIDDQGHTLIESAVALALLTAVMIPMGLLFVGNPLQRHNRELVEAWPKAFDILRTEVARQQHVSGVDTVLTDRFEFIVIRSRNDRDLVSIEVSGHARNSPGTTTQLAVFVYDPPVYQRD